MIIYLYAIARTDIISHHPYSIHFCAFALEMNGSIRELGPWYYPIYFDYLPAFRLGVILRFPLWFENLSPTNICNEQSICFCDRYCSRNAI